MLRLGRACAGVFALLLLLLPTCSALAVLVGVAADDCGMECCRRSKRCCCKNPGRVAHGHGPGIEAREGCAGRCGQVAALRGAAAAEVETGQEQACRVGMVSRLGQATEPEASWAESAFAQYERPPPRAGAREL